MPRARTRIPGFLLDPAAPPTRFGAHRVLPGRISQTSQMPAGPARVLQRPGHRKRRKRPPENHRRPRSALRRSQRRTRRRQAAERVRRRDRSFRLVGSLQGSLTVPVPSLRQDLDRDHPRRRRRGQRASCDRARACRSRDRRGRSTGRGLHVIAVGQGGGGDGGGVCSHAAPGRFRQAIAIGTHAHADLPPSVEWIESSHPFPDARSEAAGERAIAIAQQRAFGRGAGDPALGRRVGADGVAGRRPLACRQDR